MKIRFALVLLALSACTDAVPLDTVGYSDGTWRLESINDRLFTARATLEFPTRRQMVGSAPCNSYSATLRAPFPRVRTTGIVSTEIACDALADEARFFEALAAMTIAEPGPGSLILHDEAGNQMIFQRD